MKKPLADDIEIVIAQENDTLAAVADRRQRRGKTVSTDGFRFLIRNESMGVTSPLPVMRRSSGKCARRVQGEYLRHAVRHIICIGFSALTDVRRGGKIWLNNDSLPIMLCDGLEECPRPTLP